MSDFQREVRQGDAFEVIYEALYDGVSGGQVQNGDILYAMLTVRGRQLPPVSF